MRIAYLDCFSGASGDMLLAAFLDAGLPLDDLRSDLAGLGLADYDLVLTRAVKKGIAGSRLEVLERAAERPLRALGDVRRLIESSSLPPQIAAPTLRVFQRLAEAEAQVHGVAVEEVHFHEVGALDTLVDIVGFCCALRRLEIAELYASPLPLGSGSITTEHGLLPVPAPATLALLAAAGAPVVESPSPGVSAPGELVTPTGAALLSTLATFARPAMRVEQVGYGLGRKEFPWPNLLRVWIGTGIHGADHEHPHEHEHAHEHDHEPEEGHHHSHEHNHDHEHEAG